MHSDRPPQRLTATDAGGTTARAVGADAAVSTRAVASMAAPTVAHGTAAPPTDPARRSQPAAGDAEPRPWWRRVHWGLLLVLAVGGALRWWWLDYARPDQVSDFYQYTLLAEHLLDEGVFGTEGPSAWRLPAWPAMLALGALVSREPLVASAIAVAMSVAQVGLTYWLAWRVFRWRLAATAAGLVAAIAPPFVTFAPVTASEHLLTVLVLGALVTALRTGPWWALTTGLLLGGAALTRGEALAYAPPIALLAMSSHRRWAIVRSGALVVAGVVLIVGPWLVRNEVVVGRGAGLTTTGGFNFYLAHSPGPYGWRTPLPLPLRIEDEILRNEVGWRYGLQYAREHPEDLWPNTVEGTGELLAPSSYAVYFSTLDRDTDGERTVRTDLALRDDAERWAAGSSRWLLWAGLGGLLLVPVWRFRAWAAVVGIVGANWVLYAVVFWAQARYRFVVDALASVAVGAFGALLASTWVWVVGGWDAPRARPGSR